MSGKESSDGSAVELIPAPRHPPKIDLRNAGAIRREMAAVYREMRGGEIETADGTKLCYVLTQLGKMYETQVLEKRIEAIEEARENDA